MAVLEAVQLILNCPIAWLTSPEETVVPAGIAFAQVLGLVQLPPVATVPPGAMLPELQVPAAVLHDTVAAW